MTLKYWIIGVLTVLLGISSLQASWSEASLVDDEVYVFFREPARMERFDLVNEEWKEPVLLPEKSEALTAGFADESGVYLAYGSSLFRYDLEAENETFVLNQPNPIFRIVATPDVVVAVAGTVSETQLVSFRKSNNGLASTQGISVLTPSPETQITINPDTGVLYYARGSSLRRITVDAAGAFSDAFNNLWFRGPDGRGLSFGEILKAFVFPTGDKLMGGRGRVFNELFPQNYTFISDPGVQPRDVTFLGDDVPIVIGATRVVALRNNLTVAGSQLLGIQPERVFVSGDRVIVFGENAEGELAHEIVPLSDLGSPQSGAPLNQEGLAYDADYVFVDQSGTVNILSRFFATVFRWNPVTQSAAPSINLPGNPFSYFYSETRNRLYMTFAEKGSSEQTRIEYVDFSSGDQVVRTLVENSAPLALIADAGNNVLARQSFGDSRLYRSNGTTQATGNTSLNGEAAGGATRTLWDAPTNRLIHGEGGPRAVSLAGGRIGDPIWGQGGFDSQARLILIAPNRFGVLVSTGEFASLSDYSKLSTSLANEISDAAFLGDELFSIREIAGVSQIQTWQAPGYAPGDVKQLPGTPAAIKQVDEDKLVAVVIGEGGIPNFYLLDNELKVVPPAILEAPTGVSAGVVNSSSALVTWLDVSGEEEYVIERREGSEGDFVEVGRVATSVTAYTDIGLAGVGSEYEYRIIAVNGDLSSEPSTPALVQFELPGLVDGFDVIGIGESSATVVWQPLAGVTGYEVEAVQTDGNRSPVVPSPQPDSSDTSYTYTSSLRLDTEYRFRIRGVNGLGKGIWTNLVRRTLPPAPVTPTDLVVSGSLLSYLVDLRWSSWVSGGSYVIERRKSGELEFERVGQVDDNSRYRDIGLEPLTNYQYRVRFENIRGVSDYSEILEVTTPELLPPASPQGFSILNVVGGVRLSYSFSSSFTTATSVIIERRIDEDEEFTQIAEVPVGSDNSYLDQDVQPGFSYVYSIRGRNAAGVSESARQAEILAIDGVCLVHETFDQPLEDTFSEVRGGRVITDGGDSFPESGVLYFDGAFERYFVTGPLDLKFGGSIDLRGRIGGGEDETEDLWDALDSNNELPTIQYLNLDDSDAGFGGGGTWRNVASALSDTNGIAPEWQTWNRKVASLPRIDSSRGVLVRIVQSDFNGPGLDTWALDEICVLGHRNPNEAPTLDPATPVTLSANATGDPIRLNFSQWVSEDDFQDRVFYEIGAVSNPAIFSGFTVDLKTGILNLEFAPQATGSSTLEVVANDSAGGSVSHTFTVNAPTLHAPTIVREGLVELNPTTGKYEQTLTIANNGPRGIAGIQVVVTSLNNGFVLDGHEDNIAVSKSPLGSGETVSLVLEYHSEVSGVAPRPDFEVQILSPEGEPQAPGGGAPALRMLSDSSKLFSFDAVVGKTYQIEYSYDMITWKVSPVTVTAGANRAQWLDQGEPKTDCHPSECTSRYYRVVEAAGD